MIYGHYHAISLGHPAFNDALFPGLDLDKFRAYLVVPGTISHEHIGHIVGYLASEGVSIFDGYGLAGPFQYAFVVVTELEERELPARSISRLAFAYVFLGVLWGISALCERSHCSTSRAAQTLGRATDFIPSKVAGLRMPLR